jgi:hypothetical protein
MNQSIIRIADAITDIPSAMRATINGSLMGEIPGIDLCSVEDRAQY